MRILLFSTLALVGCTKDNPDYCPAHPTDPRCGGMMGSNDSGVDAPIDASDPTIDARTCFGSGNYEVCLSALPTTTETLSGTLDTGTSTKCLMTQPMGWTTRGQPESCFVVATSITISGLDVTGTRPLVLVATGSIAINGLLDVSSRITGTAKRGPGAPFGGCPSFLATPTISTNGGGGGAGGTFSTRGGAGGSGNNGMMGNTGGIAGNPIVANPAALRAGCNGQAGGDGASPGGQGGLGGGAVYLLAGNMITFSSAGIVNASGAGGAAAGSHGGGGGGGSGGMIMLSASTIAATTGKLVANGGSGSSGASNGAGGAGNDPNPSTPLTPAASVQGPSQCCDSGTGFAQGSAAGTGKSESSGLGGGGGGGGGGFIESSVALTGGVFSPTPVTP